MKILLPTLPCQSTSFNKLNPVLWVFIFLLLSLNLHAQTKERKWNLGIMGGISTYAGDLGNGMLDFRTRDFEQNLLGGFTVSRYLNASFDATVMGTYGTWGFYNTTAPDISFKGTMQHANLNIKYKLNNGHLIPEDAWLAPYIFAGMGFSGFSGDDINDGLDYPIVGGIGLRLKVTKVLSFNYQATFGYMATAYNNPNQLPPLEPTGTDKFLLHTIGLGLNLGRAKDADGDGVSDQNDKCNDTPKGVKVDDKGCPLDTDQDGVVDYQDNCPKDAGSANTKGCPDRDKDGTADMDDQCPDMAGVPELKGCPDSDGDGLIDSKDKCPNVAGVLAMDGCPDTDGDGIRDEDDLCPKVKGVALFKGCPDTDEDGIEDSRDMCPLVKGPASTNGCPDTDNDGVNDGIDKCPLVAGDPSHSGCPDTDNDRVYDDIDKCINIPGTPTNNGCPELKKEVKQLFQKALQGIQFETGKAVIKPVSFAILNAIVKVMAENPTYKLKIGGHTDNVGADDMNMTLSKDRAAAVANYLIAKGVDPLRLSSEGYGETVPVDTNESVKGRTRNRRVEFQVEFMDVVK